MDMPVAQAVLITGYKNFLATYDYDENGRLIATLPPKYHWKEGTLSKAKSWKEIGYSTNASMGTFYKYDDQGRILSKSSSDVGTFEYEYTHLYSIRTHHSRIDGHSIFYYQYDAMDQLSEIGEETEGPSNIPSKVIQHLEEHGPNDYISKTQRIITRNGESLEVIQDLEYQLPHGQLVSDTHVIPSTDTDGLATLVSMKFIWNAEGNRILVIGYPLHDISIGYKYNKFGHISSVSLIQGNLAPFEMAQYEYSASGNLKTEILFDKDAIAGSRFDGLETTIMYNSPGYPTEFKNRFFSQVLSYDDNGYGDISTGEPGYPSSTVFNNRWVLAITQLTPQDLEDGGLSNEHSHICHEALQNAGYIDSDMQVHNLFRPDMYPENMPVICSGRSAGKLIHNVFSRILLQRKKFGYRFQYGYHKELIAAKFFDPETESNSLCSNPLTRERLKVALDIHERIISHIWTELELRGYILEDGEKCRGTAHGLKSTQLWNGKLKADCQEILLCEDCYTQYAEVMAYSLGSRVGKTFSVQDFEKLHKIWSSGSDDLGKVEGVDIYNSLKSKGYLTASGIVKTKILETGLLTIFTDLDLDVEVAKVLVALSSYFSCEILTSELDMKVYEMDYNGNPLRLNTGTYRAIKYEENTNQIKSITNILKEVQDYGHDEFGNVNWIKDQHGELSIEYDKLSSRPLTMKLADGRQLLFRYDYKGQRVSKQVYDATGTLELEIRYLGRDKLGRVLIEQERTHVSEPSTTTTIYFYSPRGLFAFLRNDKYYNVLVDHIGSTRYVVRNQQVVASYNYLPYGELVYKYLQPNTEGDIRYLFSGQELDLETGWYNYNGRIYDPKIGRFHQVDPEERFFSPYKYLGNSPVKSNDPDGRSVFSLFSTGVGTVGDYSAVAAVNSNWNPAKWDFKDMKTYTTVPNGFIGDFNLKGGLITPVTPITALATTVGYSGAISNVGSSGLTAGLLNIAATQNMVDPSKWDFWNPNFFDPVFNGFSTGSGVFTSFKELGQTANKLSTQLKRSSLLSSTLAFNAPTELEIASANDAELAFWRWDWAHTKTYGNSILGASGPSSFGFGTKSKDLKKSPERFHKDKLDSLQSGLVDLKKILRTMQTRSEEAAFLIENVNSLAPTDLSKLRHIVVQLQATWEKQHIQNYKADLVKLILGDVQSTSDVFKGLVSDLVILGTINLKDRQPEWDNQSEGNDTRDSVQVNELKHLKTADMGGTNMKSLVGPCDDEFMENLSSHEDLRFHGIFNSGDQKTSTLSEFVPRRHGSIMMPPSNLSSTHPWTTKTNPDWQTPSNTKPSCHLNLSSTNLTRSISSIPALKTSNRSGRSLRNRIKESILVTQANIHETPER